MKSSWTRFVTALMLVSGLASPVLGASGSWTLNNTGVWSVTNNWASGIIASGASSTGWFTNNISAARTITIDTTSRRLGILNIGDADNTHAFTLAASGGATLTFDNGAATAQLNQTGTSKGDTISTPLALAADLKIANDSTNLLTISGGVAGTGTLTLATSGAGAVTLSTLAVNNAGGIINSGSGSGNTLISAVIGTNVTGVVQASGSSVLVLSGANTYGSGTTINNGTTLRIANTTGSATGPGAVTIAAGAILQGAGAMAGSVTNSHNGTLSPGLDGAPGGTMTMGNLTWNGGGVYRCEVASIANNEAGAGLDYDQIIVTNTLTAVPGGSNLVLRLDTLGQTLAFETNRNYSLKVMTCGKSAVLNPAEVTLDTNAFLVGGTWSVTNVNKSLYVVCQGANSTSKNYWRGTGNWSAPTNWSLGHAPWAGEDVEFDFLDVSNCTVDVFSNSLGSLTLAAGYTGTVTLSNLTVSGNCVIANGVLTHAVNGTTAQGERYKINLTVGGNLLIASNGQINADGKGYAVGYGLDGGTGQWPGSYGGRGGGSLAGLGTTYGNITAPTNLGSAGYKAEGGGAVRVTVAGTTTVHGAISANGVVGALNYGPGSGGSVFLTTGSLAGNGTIRANGGFGTGYGIGSGGGGRVAVILTNSTDFGSVAMTAYPGAGTPIGAGGTVYQQTTSHLAGQGKLIVDYNDMAIGNLNNCTLQNGKGASSYAFSEIVLTNGAVYALDTNDTLNIVGTTIRGDLTDRNQGIYVWGGTLTVPPAFGFTNYYIAINHTNATFAPASSLTVGTNATIKFDVPWTVNCPITLESGGWMSHSANGGTELNKINLTVNGNVDVQSNGQINVDNMGFIAASGSGKPANVNSAAAGHGGMGGSVGGPPGTTYGSITSPTNIGSGGNLYSGGGAVRLAVNGALAVNGTISAAGGGAAGWTCTAAGGSIFLTVASLSGNGVLKANGGAASSYSGGSGGGGRIAVILTNSASFGNLVMQAYSPAALNNNSGSAGTIYTETPAQGPGRGTLMIDGGNVPPSALSYTLISSQVTDTVVGTVVVTNKAILSINTNQSLTVNGSWTNSASFIARTNSTVVFASANSATIAGSNTFYNLAITNADKTVSFQAGKTNVVNGLLSLGSTAPGSTVTLKSTTEGSWSYLTLTPGGTQQIARVTVKDSNAGGGQALLAGKGSVDGGHNVYWVFPKIGGTVIWLQ